MAAYDPFRPYLPEPYTSPGGRLPIYFDSAGNRYPKARRSVGCPQMAAADGGNTTFFARRRPCATPTRSRTSAAPARRHRTPPRIAALRAADGPVGPSR